MSMSTKKNIAIVLLVLSMLLWVLRKINILYIPGLSMILLALSMVLVRQYRYAFSRVLTEIPAGKREPGEPPFVTAQRELQEEVGAVAGKWTDLGTLIASPGCYGETLYLYMAEDLRFGETHPDEDEFLEPLRLPFDEAVRQCMDGTLTDAKTVAAILKGKILRAR